MMITSQPTETLSILTSSYSLCQNHCEHNSRLCASIAKPEIKTRRTAFLFPVGLGIVFGAACTLSHMGAVLREAVETLPLHQTKVFLAVLEQLRWFAGMQIRNVAVRPVPCLNIKLLDNMSIIILIYFYLCYMYV